MIKNKEIEYKYWAENLTVDDFQSRIIETTEEFNEPIYVVSCDDYYEISNNSQRGFIRFRKGGNTSELTLKRKQHDNVVRDEININVSDNADIDVAQFLTMLGYEKSFQVYKEAWIWYCDKCVISYYTLSDGRSVIELEAIDYKTIKDGVSIINIWEKRLKLKSLKKESRSLYEIYTQEAINGLESTASESTY